MLSLCIVSVQPSESDDDDTLLLGGRFLFLGRFFPVIPNLVSRQRPSSLTLTRRLSTSL